MHGFEIRLGDNPGIDFVGALPVASQQPFFNFGNFSDRSVIVNGATYCINDSNVYAADWGDLSNSVGPR